MKSSEIRSKFLDFFESKKHSLVSSAPMVIKNDPTLMFTNAGMNQFKDFFLGNDTPTNPRIADTQKCLRVSGKHNDLEEVGIDTYHHTMFEMLGNWSIGEYFKKEAISWAWELLTEVYKVDKNKIYITVFEGDPSENLERDNEASEEWKHFVSEDRILYCDKKDNFWEMGDTGPCGPCSEIHVDLRSDEEKSKIPGYELVNKGHPQVIEVWNLVFIQFNRKADGKLENLKSKHVDTGMGFERLAMLLQGKISNYDTDVFSPIIKKIEELSGESYGKSERIDIAIRVISDHIRAVTVAISEGQLPGNAKAGYVIRRILRRAVRYGYTFLGLKEPFMYKLVPVLAAQFDGVFPEIASQSDFSSRVIKEEEISFLNTLEKGLKRLDALMEDARKSSVSELKGGDIFELYDTFGFPVDLTALIARENNLQIDEKGFEQEMTVQKQRSKADASKSSGDWTTVNKGKTEFVGYDSLVSNSKILRYREVKQKDKIQFHLVLGSTPFYPEGGGQVGDTGFLIDGSKKTKVLNTVKENDLILHLVNELPSDLNATFELNVDAQRRYLTENNHSATHLLHAALRTVLGDHVQQKGSLVNDGLLRFDFSHFAKMTAEEIDKVEAIVNNKIRENVQLKEERSVPFDEAVKKGAMALFGEKYGDSVRVITFDPDYSVELCGGTHVSATGKIGLFKIISEGSVAAGVRRIEAITAEQAEQHVRANEKLIHDVSELLKHPKDLKKAISTLIEEKSQLQKAIGAFASLQENQVKQTLQESIAERKGVNILTARVELPNADSLKNILFSFKQQYGSLFAVIAAEIDDKPMIGIMISENLTQREPFHAGKLVREWAKNIQGGGGGQAFFATAGGKDVSGLDKVIDAANELVAKEF